MARTVTLDCYRLRMRFVVDPVCPILALSFLRVPSLLLSQFLLQYIEPVFFFGLTVISPPQSNISPPRSLERQSRLLKKAGKRPFEFAMRHKGGPEHEKIAASFINIGL